MSEEEPIKIVIPVEEDDTPMKVETPKSGAKAAASDATRKVAGLAKSAASRAAHSELGRKAAGKAQELTDRGVRTVGNQMADTAEQQARQTVDAVQERIKQTDWEKEAKVGIASGLQWLSGRLNEMSERFTPAEEGEQGSDNVKDS
jgi:hypothetical protein